MELVRRHEMTNRPQPANLLGQSLVELDRRMEEEVAFREAHYRHPGRERKRQPDSAHSQVFEWAIDDADVRREWLVDVNWLVNRGTHLADRQYPGNVELRRFALDAYLHGSPQWADSRHRLCRDETWYAPYNTKPQPRQSLASHLCGYRRAARTWADHLTCAHGLSWLPRLYLSGGEGQQQAPLFDNRRAPAR